MQKREQLLVVISNGGKEDDASWHESKEKLLDWVQTLVTPDGCVHRKEISSVDQMLSGEQQVLGQVIANIQDGVYDAIICVGYRAPQMSTGELLEFHDEILGSHETDEPFRHPVFLAAVEVSAA